MDGTGAGRRMSRKRRCDFQSQTNLVRTSSVWHGYQKTFWDCLPARPPSTVSASPRETPRAPVQSPPPSFSHPALTFFPQLLEGRWSNQHWSFVFFSIFFARLQGCITFLCSFAGDKQSCGGVWQKTGFLNGSQRQSSRKWNLKKAKNLFWFFFYVFCLQVFLWSQPSEIKHTSVRSLWYYEMICCSEATNL